MAGNLLAAAWAEALIKRVHGDHWVIMDAMRGPLGIRIEMIWMFDDSYVEYLLPYTSMVDVYKINKIAPMGDQVALKALQRRAIRDFEKIIEDLD